MEERYEWCDRLKTESKTKRASCNCPEMLDVWKIWCWMERRLCFSSFFSVGRVPANPMAINRMELSTMKLMTTTEPRKMLSNRPGSTTSVASGTENQRGPTMSPFIGRVCNGCDVNCRTSVAHTLTPTRAVMTRSITIKVHCHFVSFITEHNIVNHKLTNSFISGLFYTVLPHLISS